MKILIITHSSSHGVNQKQAMECMNILGHSHEYLIIGDPEAVDKDLIKDIDKIIMIVPEWNASFPFSFKKLIDDSGHPSWLKGSHIILIGTSNTTFGNIMGITHLKYILEWIGADVFPKLICIPHIDRKFANDNIIIDERLQQSLKEFRSSKIYI